MLVLMMMIMMHFRPQRLRRNDHGSTRVLSVYVSETADFDLIEGGQKSTTAFDNPVQRKQAASLLRGQILERARNFEQRR